MSYPPLQIGKIFNGFGKSTNADICGSLGEVVDFKSVAKQAFGQPDSRLAVRSTKSVTLENEVGYGHG